jgi:RIO-like serine/threonine protein kinase
MAITKYQKTINPVRISGSTAHGVVYKISDNAVAKIPFNRDLAEDVATYEFEMARALMRRGINVARPLEVGTVAIGQEGKSLAYIMEFVEGKGFYDLPPVDDHRRLVAKKYHEEMNKARGIGFNFGYERDCNYTNFIVDNQGKVKLIDFITWTHPKVKRPCTMEELF